MAVDNLLCDEDLPFAQPLDRDGRLVAFSIEEAKQFARYFRGRGCADSLVRDIERAMVRHARKGWRFVMVNPSDLEDATLLMLRMKRSRHCLAIYMVMIANLKFGSSECELSQQEIAEVVGIPPCNASSCMVQMSRAGLICSRGRHGAGKRWYVSPASCWQGDEMERRRAIADFKKMLVEQEEGRRRRRRPGPRSRADKQLDADIVDLQASFDARAREAAAGKCDRELL